MKKWEYLILKTEKNKNVSITELGEKGWELVCVVPIQSEENYQNYKHFFKRKKK